MNLAEILKNFLDKFYGDSEESTEEKVISSTQRAKLMYKDTKLNRLMGEVASKIKEHEGFRAYPYEDSVYKKVTIGYGRNLDDVPLDKEEYKVIIEGNPYRKALRDKGLSVVEILKKITLSGTEADFLFRKDLLRAKKTLDRIFKRRGIKDVPDDIYKVFWNMAYNLGYKLDKFDDTLKALKRKDYKAVARGMYNSLWRKQTGNRAKELINIVLAKANSRKL